MNVASNSALFINNQQTTFIPDTSLMNLFCAKHMHIHTDVIYVRTFYVHMLYYLHNYYIIMYVCLEQGGACSCICHTT